MNLLSIASPPSFLFSSFGTLHSPMFGVDSSFSPIFYFLLFGIVFLETVLS